MERRPIPRVDGRSLGYLRFLREFALPGLPVILTGLGGDWRATTAWRSLASLEGRGLDMSEVVQVQVGQGGVVTLPLAQFFELLRARDTAAASAGAGASGGGGASADDDPQAPPRQKRRRTSAESAETVPEAGRQDGGHEATRLPPGTLYLRNWRFHEANPQLLSDYATPRLFSLGFAEQAGLVSSNSFTWLYIGEAGSSTPTHVDVMNSSAWLFVTSGVKRWRMVTASDLRRCYTRGAGPSSAEGGDSIGGDLLDLFGSDAELEAALGPGEGEEGGAVMFEGDVREGELIFTPSKCAHAVQNTTLSIALTSNFVDLSNVIDVYDSLSGVHPNGNPLPFFAEMCAEQLLALCIPRAERMLAEAWPEEAAEARRLLRRVLHGACARRAGLLAARLRVMEGLVQSLDDAPPSDQQEQEEQEERQREQGGQQGQQGRQQIVRCCLSCGHRNHGTHGDCAGW